MCCTLRPSTVTMIRGRLMRSLEDEDEEETGEGGSWSGAAGRAASSGLGSRRGVAGGVGINGGLSCPFRVVISAWGDIGLEA